MSKRISKKRAKELWENEKKSQELASQGIRPKVSRQEKKRRMRMSKTEKFIDMLKFRGGHYEQKKK